MRLSAFTHSRASTALVLTQSCTAPPQRPLLQHHHDFTLHADRAPECRSFSGHRHQVRHPPLIRAGFIFIVTLPYSMLALSPIKCVRHPPLTLACCYLYRHQQSVSFVFFRALLSIAQASKSRVY